MRRVPLLLTLLAVGTALALGLGVLESNAGAAPAMQARGQVNMTITCTDNVLDDVQIRPWTAAAAGSAQISWRLLPSSSPLSVTVSPKSTSSWPFDSTLPLTVNRGASGTSSGAINVSSSGRHYYNITVNCGSGPEVIDPQMDIDP